MNTHVQASERLGESSSPKYTIGSMLGYGQTSEPNLSKYIIDAPGSRMGQVPRLNDLQPIYQGLVVMIRILNLVSQIRYWVLNPKSTRSARQLKSHTVYRAVSVVAYSA